MANPLYIDILFLLNIEKVGMRRIYGIGVDICQISRVKDLVERSAYHRTRFLTGTFHEVEQAEFTQKGDSFEYLASRWALKEALVKATGRTDLEYKGIYLKKPEPIEGKRVRPFVEVTGDRNTSIFKELNIVQIHSSISAL